MVDKNLVKLHFSKASKSYDEFANIQKFMAKELIKYCPKSNNALEIGCATGYFTSLLEDVSKNLTSCDISDKMVEVARKRVSNDINFIVTDAESIEFNNLDLIASNATFQWFNYLDNTLKKYYNMLNSNGVLAFSIFGKDTFKEINQAFNSSACKNKTHTQEFFSANKLEKILKDANFTDITIKSFQKRVYFKNLQELFKSIKSVGASNAVNIGYIGKACYKEFLKNYQTSFIQDNRIYCTYEVIICFARRD